MLNDFSSLNFQLSIFNFQLLKVSAFIICTILFVSCTGKGEQYTNLKPLTLGFVDSIPYSISRNKQLLDSLGLTLNLTTFSNTTQRDSALFNGTIDGTIIDYIDAIKLQSANYPIRIVMDIDTTYQLIAGIGTEIRKPEQLSGRNIATSRNTVIDYITDRILQKAGIAPGEINKAEIRKTSLRLDLLQNGLVDAAVLPQPYAATAIENGNRLLISTTETGISIAGMVFTNAALKGKRREIEVYIEKAKKPNLPPADELKQTIDWLKQNKLVPGSYTATNLADTIKGIKLK